MGWLDNIWDAFFEEKDAEMSDVFPLVRPVTVSGTYNGNYVEGEVYRPRRPNGKGIIYCHGGFQDTITPDVGAYVNTGYTLLHADFENEGNVTKSDPNRDVIEVVDSAAMLADKYSISDISLVGVSRGGYVALKTFGHYSDKFRKVVCFIGPINMHDPTHPYDWDVWAASGLKEKEMVEAAKAYFNKAQDPVEMAKVGLYYGLARKMFLVYGSKDLICPPKDMMVPFVNLTKARYLVLKCAHSAHRTKDGQIATVAFLRW